MAVDFDPTRPLPDPPTVTLAQTSGLADGQAVDATLTGLAPQTDIYVNECSADGPCAPIGRYRTDDTGSYQGPIRVWRWFGAPTIPGDTTPTVDCATEPCVMRIDSATPANRQIPTVTITFEPTGAVRQPPVIELVDPGPFHDGDDIRARVTGTDAGSYVDASVCSRDGAFCFGGTAAPPSEGSSIEIAIRVSLPPDAPPGDPCAAGCFLVVSPCTRRT